MRARNGVLAAVHAAARARHSRPPLPVFSAVLLSWLLLCDGAAPAISGGGCVCVFAGACARVDAWPVGRGRSCCWCWCCMVAQHQHNAFPPHDDHLFHRRTHTHIIGNTSHTRLPHHACAEPILLVVRLLPFGSHNGGGPALFDGGAARNAGPPVTPDARKSNACQKQTPCLLAHVRRGRGYTRLLVFVLVPLGRLLLLCTLHAACTQQLACPLWPQSGSRFFYTLAP